MADPTRHTGEASSTSVQLEGCVTRFPALILNNRERYGSLSWKPKDFDADEGHAGKRSWFGIDLEFDDPGELSYVGFALIMAFSTQRARADEKDNKETEQEEAYRWCR